MWTWPTSAAPGGVCACISAASRPTQRRCTHLPPSVGLPTGTSAGTTRLLGSWPGKMAAELLFYLGLVLVNTGDLPPLGATAATHRALEGEEEVKGEKQVIFTFPFKMKW